MIQLDTIPHKPGCYLYKDVQDKIIYVGKAKDLRKRVGNYFQKKVHDLKTKQLISHIESMDFIVTNTEVEALLLENTLIKKHQPKYNINLKDSKTYAYLKVTDEIFPRIVVSRKKDSTGSFFGPFTSAKERDYIKDVVLKTFKLRTCKHFPKRPCLRYHINLCDAPCINGISVEAYNSKISDITLLLNGKTDKLKSRLEKRMNVASKKQKFEIALELRNQISALSQLSKRQSVERQKKYNQDVINYIEKEGIVYLALFHIYKGTLGSKQEFSFEYIEGFFEDFLKQYYAVVRPPQEVIIPTLIDPMIESFLKTKRGLSVQVTTPKQGQKKTLLSLVKTNIEESFFGNLQKLESLYDQLQLPKIPHIIECFDISHLSGTHTVASMVQFKDGKPNKQAYRRYKIRTVCGVDDFSSIAEVVRRRYKKLLSEHSTLPDLIVIDGGKGQLKFAVNELRQLGLKTPIISLAKREEEIFTPGLKNSILLSKKDKGLQLLQYIRDEAHRFAITYNRLLRKKAFLK